MRVTYLHLLRLWSRKDTECRGVDHILDGIHIIRMMLNSLFAPSGLPPTTSRSVTTLHRWRSPNMYQKYSMYYALPIVGNKTEIQVDSGNLLAYVRACESLKALQVCCRTLPVSRLRRVCWPFSSPVLALSPPVPLMTRSRAFWARLISGSSPLYSTPCEIASAPFDTCHYNRISICTERTSAISDLSDDNLRTRERSRSVQRCIAARSCLALFPFLKPHLVLNLVGCSTSSNATGARRFVRNGARSSLE